jgi:Fungal specific transcription factor domain
MFIGDSANLSLLQDIRRLVRTSIGSCPFVEDPFRYIMVESVPDGRPSWLHMGQAEPPTLLSLPEATDLIRSYVLATGCVLDLFDEADLLSHLPHWLATQPDNSSALSPIYYLVFAIGAQTTPEDKDAMAETFFDYGRYLTAMSFMEDPSISTVQAYAMISMYMLGASRRNAAFMYLGIAVRAAYALGLHKADIAALFPPAEFQIRERLWKVIRILDLFMSASLGRPPSTSETRDTESPENYSASADLCDIFEAILTEIYAKRRVSTQVLESISEHHRRWTDRFHQGLATDRIDGQNALDQGRSPNIGLLHVKEAYYWTIMLMTRPFYIEYVSDIIAAAASPSPLHGSKKPSRSASNEVLAHACVDSAVRTIDLLKVLTDFEGIPKRLPFVVNSIFVAALVLGLGYFADLYTIFPLEQGLMMAQRLLALFPYDAVAKRHWNIVEYLRDACSTFMRQKAAPNMSRHAQRVRGIFGHIPDEMQTFEAGLRADRINPSSRQISDPGNSFRKNTIEDRSVPFDANGRQDSNQHWSATSPPGHDAQAGEGILDFASNDTTDILMTPLMSPRTLWFASYEENNPLFTTFNNTSAVQVNPTTTQSAAR